MLMGRGPNGWKRRWNHGNEDEFELDWCAGMETVIGYLDRMFMNGGELNAENRDIELPDGCENEHEEMIRKLYFIKDRNEKGHENKSREQEGASRL
jgi:hypothetical protein